MKKTIVYVRKMDCPSEIKMIEGLFEGDDGVKQMNFNLGERQVTFFHKTDESHILGKLKDVGLQGKQLETREVSESILCEGSARSSRPECRDSNAG